MFKLPFEIKTTPKNNLICVALAAFLIWSGLWFAALFFTTVYFLLNDSFPVKFVSPSKGSDDSSSGDPL